MYPAINNPPTGSFAYLQIAGVFLSFFLKVTAGFVLCVGLARLSRDPGRRFRTWLAFLAGTIVYWAVLLAREVLRLASSSVTGTGGASAVPAWRHLAVPWSWGSWINRSELALGVTYLAGVTILLCASAWRHFRLHVLLQHGRRASAELDGLFNALCRDFGLGKAELLVLPGIISPATACWWKPRVIVPAVCEEMGATPQLADVLSHELAHIRRQDYLWATLSDMACALLFFHPAVWHARKQMRMERELACDRAVVEARPDHRADYASSLARFVRVRMLHSSATYGVDFAASASFLSTRIHCILEEPEKAPWWKKVPAVAAGAAFVITFGVLCPALSVLVDFGPNLQQHGSLRPVAATSRTSNQHGRKPLQHVRHEAQPHTSPAEYRDDLTSLRVHNAVPETPAYELSDTGETLGSSDLIDREDPAWREPSPGYPEYRTPSVGSIVLSTIDGIASAERNERHEHAAHR